MKIRSVSANNHKHAFEVTTAKGVLPLAYVKTDPPPTKDDPLAYVYVDPELGNEGFTYVLRSGAEGSVHVDSVLEYNEDPEYMRELLLHRLTVQAIDLVKSSRLSKREIIRRTGTSPAQFYRLLDPTNTTKSIDKMVVLLTALGCEVDFAVRKPVDMNVPVRVHDARKHGRSQ